MDHRMAEPLPVGRTMKAAHVAARTTGDPEIVKAAELVEAVFVRGVSPSAAARKMLALLIQAAAGDGWQTGPHCVEKRLLRGSHESNDRLGDTLDELQATLLRVRVTAPDGASATLTAPIISYRIEHEADDGKVWWQFSDPARQAMQLSNAYAALNRAALLAIESRYAVTIYERGCLLAGRRDPRWSGSVEDLKDLLGTPAGAYRTWDRLKVRVLEPAMKQVNQIADFDVSAGVRHGKRNKVVGVELWFLPKDPEARKVARREARASRIGRKARRDGAAERVVTPGKHARRLLPS